MGLKHVRGKTSNMIMMRCMMYEEPIDQVNQGKLRVLRIKAGKVSRSTRIQSVMIF